MFGVQRYDTTGKMVVALVLCMRESFEDCYRRVINDQRFYSHIVVRTPKPGCTNATHMLDVTHANPLRARVNLWASSVFAFAPVRASPNPTQPNVLISGRANARKRTRTHTRAHARHVRDNDVGRRTETQCVYTKHIFSELCRETRRFYGRCALEQPASSAQRNDNDDNDEWRHSAAIACATIYFIWGAVAATSPPLSSPPPPTLSSDNRALRVNSDDTVICFVVNDRVDMCFRATRARTRSPPCHRLFMRTIMRRLHAK